MTHWMMAGSSSIGKAHIDASLPNQDSLFTYQDSDICVAVVCDGAGSAVLSEQGASYFAKAVGDFLVNNAKHFANDFSQNDPFNTDFTQTAFATIRHHLASQIPDGFSLKDYHSTITAVLLLPTLQQALLLQIGDSPLIASQFERMGQQIDYFTRLQVYGEESTTEYINETHFITQNNWRDFLRIERLDTQHVDIIALMSDGCGDLVLTGGTSSRQVYRPFFGNLLFNLLQTQDRTTADSLIQTTLDNPATYRLTGDDKTLVVLIKAQNPAYRHSEPLLEKSENLSEENLSHHLHASVWQTQPLTLSQAKLPENFVENDIESTVLIGKAEKVENAVLPDTALPPAPPSSVENVINRHENTINQQALPQPVPTDTPNATKKLALVGLGSLIAIGIATTAWLMRFEPINNNATLEAQTLPPTTATSGVNATSTPALTAVPMSATATLSSPNATPNSAPFSTATAAANVTTASSTTASQR